MAKVSIIVPIYNVEQYLPKCLDSLISQTFKDIEIWAVSDGSPDNSVSIIKEYAKKDKRVKCIEKENGGYGSVLEYAISKIKSEYFLICDPDDWLAKDAIETLYNAATKYKVDLVYGSYYYVYSDNYKEEYTRGANLKGLFNPNSNKVYKGEDKNMFLFLTPSPHAKLYKTSLAQGIEFPHKVSFTDLLLYVLYLSKAKSIVHIDKGLAYYLVDRAGNSMTDVKPRIADYYNTVFKSIWSQYELTIKNKSPLFYYRMFDQAYFILNEISRIKEKQDFIDKRVLVCDLFKLCTEHSKEIKQILRSNNLEDSSKRKMVNNLLLNKLTCKAIFNNLSMRYYNDKHKKSDC